MIAMVFSKLFPTTDKWQPIVRQLEGIVGKDGVVRRKEELLTYECDGLASYRQRPALVVLPRNTEEVAATVKICHDNDLPWVARGAGTGLSGGALPNRDGLLIVTARMNRILHQDLDNHCITVQPGVINNWVTQAVSGAGFYYAPDPSSQIICSIGGNVAENSGGVHCLKYGVTTNHVLGLKIVTTDGSISDVGGNAWIRFHRAICRFGRNFGNCYRNYPAGSQTSRIGMCGVGEFPYRRRLWRSSSGYYRRGNYSCGNGNYG